MEATLILTSLSRKLLRLPIGCILFWHIKNLLQNSDKKQAHIRNRNRLFPFKMINQAYNRYGNFSRFFGISNISYSSPFLQLRRASTPRTVVTFGECSISKIILLKVRFEESSNRNHKILFSSNHQSDHSSKIFSWNSFNLYQSLYSDLTMRRKLNMCLLCIFKFRFEEIFLRTITKIT